MDALKALRFGALLALVLAVATHPALAYDDADDPATELAAETAVARLGGARAGAVRPSVRKLVAEVRNVAGLAGNLGGATRGIKASVQDVAGAMRELDAAESELEVRIALPADVLFDVDKAVIRPDAARALAHLATVVRAYSGEVRLTGHTDSDASDAHNLDLSKRRAESVRTWLVEKEALAASRFVTEGMGEANPVAPNDTPANKQLNRRVEVVVRKK